MIVEFIGCTGAGKSTLIRRVQQNLALRAEVTSAYTLVVSRFGLHGIRHPSVRNLIQEVVGLPYFVSALPRHKDFIGFNLRMIARQVHAPFFAFNNLRSLERKLAVYEMIRRSGQDKIVLVDEGTVLQAHHLFVFTDQRFTSEDIARFSSLLPLPDAIVYIRAPVDDLLQRSLNRPDPPRVMKKKSPEQNEKSIRQAVALFDKLVDIEALQGCVLIVDNPDSRKNDQAQLTRQIADFILCSQKNSPLICVGPGRDRNGALQRSMNGEL